MKRRFFFMFIFVLYAICSFSQKFEWRAGMHGFFDNREYFSGYATAQTIFGSRFFAESGFLLNKNNRFRIGLSYLYEFGSKGDLLAPDITMYYHGKNNFVNFYLGAFPRYGLINHPRILLTDTLEYYRPNIEGLYLELKKNGIYQDVWLDWTSRQTKTKRETFLLGGKGGITKGIFLYEHNFIMYHFAHAGISLPNDHIRDNGGITIMTGINIGHKSMFDTLFIKSGIASSYDRIRGVYSLQFAKGWISDFNISYKGFGIYGTLYFGERQTHLYGEKFFTSKTYQRFDLYYCRKKGGMLEGKLRFSFNITDKEIDWSQSIRIFIDLDNNKVKNTDLNE